MWDESQFQKIKDCAAEYRRSKRGNVAMITGLCMIPLFFLMGAAVDVNRHVSADADIQDALDAAALYATTMKTETSAEITSEAKKLFLQNIDERVKLNLTSFHTYGDSGRPIA